jgi:hypothetical protein
LGRRNFRRDTGDWKVPGTRRMKNLRYIAPVFTFYASRFPKCGP